MAFTSDASSPSVVNAAGALITLWGIIVLVAAGPRYLSRRGKMIRLSGGDAVTGFVRRDGEVPATAA